VTVLVREQKLTGATPARLGLHRCRIPCRSRRTRDACSHRGASGLLEALTGVGHDFLLLVDVRAYDRGRIFESGRIHLPRACIGLAPGADSGGCSATFKAGLF
jgi:hypothetical protein